MKNNDHYYYYNNSIQGYKTYVYDGIDNLETSVALKMNAVTKACSSQKSTIDLQRSVFACNRLADNTDILSSHNTGHFMSEQLTTVRGLFY